MLAIARATVADFRAIRDLERLAFQPFRQASDASLRRSLGSRRQSVWVVRDRALRPALAGILVLWHHPHRLRVYDVATHPERRGAGIGYRLMQHAERMARKAGCAWVTLEADPKEPGLVPWYEAQGYLTVRRLPQYYHGGRAAVRMVKPVAGATRGPSRRRPGRARSRSPSRRAGPGATRSRP
jgi:[ribosomal protein S18]-alanine N-acetyltransferase